MYCRKKTFKKVELAGRESESREDKLSVTSRSMLPGFGQGKHL